MKTIFSLGIFLFFGVIFFLAGMWSQEIDGEFYKFFTKFFPEFFLVLHIILSLLLLWIINIGYSRFRITTEKIFALYGASRGFGILFLDLLLRLLFCVFAISGFILATLKYKTSNISFEMFMGAFIISAIITFVISVLLHKCLFPQRKGK